MDWRDLLDERKRRQANGYNGFTMPSQQMAAVTPSAASEDDDDGGFFGNFNPVKTVTDTVGGVAGFFGNMVKDVVETAGDAVGGIKDVVEGSIESNNALGRQEKLTEISKKYSDQMNAVIGDAESVDQLPVEKQQQWERLKTEREQAMEKYKKETNFDQKQANANKQVDEAQDVDALKTAAASGETFLNAATLGVGGVVKGAAKGGVKQIAKGFGKEVLKDTGEAAAKRVAANTAARTAGGAGQRLAQGAFEGGAIGAGMGFLQPFADEGEDADIGDAWKSALMGGAIGGALGGAVPLLDKNVRAGVREMPGAIRTGTGEIIDQAKQFTPTAVASRSPEVLALDDHMAMLNQKRDQLVASGLSENSPEVRANATAYADALAQKNQTIRMATQGGYIKNPFYREADDASGSVLDGASDAADAARRQLAGETVQPVDPIASQYIGEEVAKRSSPQQYIDELTDQLWEANKKGQGVETFLQRADPNSYDVTGRVTTSNNNQFYRDYYKAHGSKPTKQGIRDIVEQELTGGPSKTGIHTNILDSANEYGDAPFARDIYQQLVDREAGMAQTLQQGPPADMYNQFAGDIGQPVAQNADTAIPRPITGPPAENMGTGSFDDPRALQRNLGRMEAETNPSVDFLDRNQVPRPVERPGVQQSLDTATPNPYDGMTPDPNRLALPQGDLPQPKTVSQAKRAFKTDGELVDFVNKKKPGSKPIELGANVADGRNIATRQTPAGVVKPLAKNNAHITQDDVEAIRAIAADDTSSAFTMTKTPEMNLEEALRNRGGQNSKEFRTLDKFNQSIRTHTAEYTDFITEKRDWLERFIKEGNLDGAAAKDMRPYLEAADDKASQAALDAYRTQYGDQAANAMEKLRIWWRSTKDQVRNDTNAVIKNFAGEDRMMGDLGPSYVPRVYKSGTPGFKEAVLDVAHGKMDAIGGEKGLFNLKNGTGYLSKEAETTGGGILRNSEGIPLNSEFAKPNTTYLSAAQKRTANGPIKEMEDPLTSMMRYFEATGRARYYTEDIARGQTLRDAIQLVNNETGNLRQMYKSFEDQVNALAGKTARIDRPFVDSKNGAQFVNVASKLQSRVAKSTILGSVNSALAQTGQLPLIAAENGGKNFAGGMSDLMKFVRGGADDPMVGSALMKARYPKYEDIFKVTKAGKAANKGTAIIAKPFRLIEHAAAELAWRSSYRRAIADGFEAGSKEALQEADRITAKIIGERSPGARAALYESKALSPVTSYTLEVNQLYQVGKQYFKRDPIKAAKLVGAIWLYNQGYEALTGNKLNADPLQATLDAGKIMTDQNYIDENGEPIGTGERLLRAAGRLGGEAIDATPLGGPVVGQLYPENGFRIPFGGGGRVLSQQDIFGDSNFGRYGGGTPLASGISNPLLLLGIPGMAQLQRSVEGANAVNAGASMTPGGDERFAIDPTSQEELWRAILLGQYGTQAGREYLQQQNNSLAGYAQ